ncbi:phosphotransferase enzyme family protein [Elizabethkingia sp. JS20170427COW]|uniref:phosphotransferase enzyme family protein n=1 Tax=Elizabethkingia sp. JS20170427COW TaxID=2583851 RepID=UPI001110C0E9|nr:aminoglycoside phosphotransferase family protein [Elizabethkingia sp. JS20170427COW]QCX52425.1 aminoglycoside phosphotransferase family protein [Elizabethkingia sp. JS20170427COW]
MNYSTILNTFITTQESDNVSIQAITDGHINTTLQVSILENGDTKHYILQKINHYIFKNPKAIMNSIEVVNQHLHQNGYPYERLETIPNLKGELLSIDENGNYWRMTKYIPNTYCVTKVENKEQAYEAAQTLSVFYSKILDLNPELIESSIPGFIDFEKRINDYKKALEAASDSRIQEAQSEIDFINLHLDLPNRFVENQKNGNFPLRVVHADPKISNVLFDNDSHKGRCVIDLDTLMPATILYDFGDMVRSYTNLREEDDPIADNIFSKEYFDAVKEGFLSHTSESLTDFEKQNLDYAGQVVVFIQAVRFLTDFLDNDQYYKINYPTHNLDRTKNQINLVKELLKLEPAL